MVTRRTIRLGGRRFVVKVKDAGSNKSGRALSAIQVERDAGGELPAAAPEPFWTTQLRRAVFASPNLTAHVCTDLLDSITLPATEAR